MAFIKHIGQIVTTQQKVVVMFRQLPEEPNSCLLVDVQGLSDDMHNDLMNEVESASAQQQVDFYNHAHTHFFRDGSKMLERLHHNKLFIKLDTNKVMMTPDNKTNIRLDKLNDQLGTLEKSPNITEADFNKQLNLDSEAVTVGDEVKPLTVTKKDNKVLDDFALAKGYVTQAEGMETEAKKLRVQAYELIPKRKLTSMLKKENAIA
ncbi:MAG TPA: hypothetical protein DCS22_05455 [Flavobacteriaceae bacterium]|nr:hypothetical protein [Flavobacteriaceae bacterium]|tara:strand:- start:281 stop:898 length:618 start_codon:yes stop_codon:yes gene_type:complete